MAHCLDKVPFFILFILLPVCVVVSELFRLYLKHIGPRNKYFAFVNKLVLLYLEGVMKVCDTAIQHFTLLKFILAGNACTAGAAQNINNDRNFFPYEELGLWDTQATHFG